VTTTTPALVHLDQADQALTALLAWRAVDASEDKDTKAWSEAIERLRDTADRIEELSRPGGAV